MNVINLLPWAVFGACFCAVWALLSHFAAKASRSADHLDKRLEELRLDQRVPEIAVDNTRLEEVAEQLSKVLQSPSQFEQSELKVRLANAGFSSPNASSMFLAVKLAVMVAGGIIGAGAGFTLFGVTQNGFLAPIAAAGIAFYVPELVLAYLKSSRQERLFLSLPNALDMLVCCVEVGQGLDAALRRVVQQLDDTAPDLCFEFKLYNFQVSMGRPRAEALHDLAVRAGIDDLNALASVLIQADRFGSSIANNLRDLADGMRVKRRQLAEERAQKTAVKLVFPLVLFIFPGIFAVLVGPAAILMMKNMLNGE